MGFNLNMTSLVFLEKHDHDPLPGGRVTAAGTWVAEAPSRLVVASSAVLATASLGSQVEHTCHQALAAVDMAGAFDLAWRRSHVWIVMAWWRSTIMHSLFNSISIGVFFF